MSTITLTTNNIRAITRLLNGIGWRGYRKDLALRVNLDTGYQTLNYDAAGEHQDMADIRELHEWRGEEVELINGRACLDVWLYRQGMLEHTSPVYIAAIGNGRVAAFDDPPDANEILQAAVAAQASDKGVRHG